MVLLMVGVLVVGNNVVDMPVVCDFVVNKLRMLIVCLLVRM
jgi:hypothetical protein